jgi:signal transduction histidine kinase/CheY-like chemotaxis protein
MTKSTILIPPASLATTRDIAHDSAGFTTLLDLALRDPTEHHIQRLHILYRAAHILAAQTDMDALIRAVFRDLLDALNSKQSLLYAHDAAGHTLHLLAERGVSPELRAALQWLPVDATDGRVAARAAATQHLEVTSGFWADAVTAAAEAPLLITLPLIAGGALVGVWQLLSPWHHTPDAADLTALATIGEEIALALRRTNLIAALKHQHVPAGSLSREQPPVEHVQTEFITTVSHELRTPLTSIAGYTELLLDGAAGTLNEEQQISLSIVKHNVDRLTGIIEDLLDISRIESGRIHIKRALVNLNQVIGNAVELLRPQIRRKFQELSLELDPHLPLVWGDDDRLTRAVVNLVANAHKYTPEYGPLQISSRAAEGLVMVAVTDTGIGLSAREQEHLFEKFYRAHEAADQIRQGAGLGLAITRSIAQLHGGDILVNSQPGRGSTFTLRLPQASGAPQTREQARILVVADVPAINQRLRTLLERDGRQTLPTYSAAEALALAQRERPDLIIVDAKLPDMDGFQLAERLSVLPDTMHTPVLIAAIVADSRCMLRSALAGYFARPIDVQQLIERVQRLIGRQGEILVAIAHREAAKEISEILKQHHYTTLHVADDGAAIRRMRIAYPDLVLLDRQLPESGGIEVIRALQMYHPAIIPPIILVADRALPPSAQLLATSRCLTRATGTEELAQEISRYLQERA